MIKQFMAQNTNCSFAYTILPRTLKPCFFALTFAFSRNFRNSWLVKYTFFDKYPSPVKLEGATETDIVELFQKESKHSFYKDKKAKLILECVRKDGYTKSDHQEFIDEIIISTAKELKSLIAETKEVEKLIRELLPKFGYKFQSMRGIDDIAAANLINEIVDIERFPTAAKLSKFA